MNAVESSFKLIQMYAHAHEKTTSIGNLELYVFCTTNNSDMKFWAFQNRWISCAIEIIRIIAKVKGKCLKCQFYRYMNAIFMHWLHEKCKPNWTMSNQQSRLIEWCVCVWSVRQREAEKNRTELRSWHLEDSKTKKRWITWLECIIKIRFMKNAWTSIVSILRQQWLKGPSFDWAKIFQKHTFPSVRKHITKLPEPKQKNHLNGYTKRITGMHDKLHFPLIRIDRWMIHCNMVQMITCECTP